jgi:diguanylate cyclase (GGDEF)-like protein/PAS domain S-box-containing protein
MSAVAVVFWRMNRRLAAEIAERRQGETIMRSTLDNMAEAVLMVDERMRLSNCNQRYVEITGFEPAFLYGQPLYEQVLRRWADENGLPERIYERALVRARSRDPFRHTFVHHGRAYEGKHVPLPGGGFVRTVSDVTERDRAEAVLRDSEARLRQLLELAPTAILVSSVDAGTLLFANQKALDLAGCSAADIGALPVSHFYLRKEDLLRLQQRLNQHGSVNDYEVQLRRGDDGRPIWALVSAMNGEFDGEPAVISAINDITARKQAEAALERAREELERTNRELQRVNADLAQAASTDGLTGLANRRRLEEAAANERARAQRHRHPLSAILFDLDWFKLVNDRHGHETGDDVLREVARRLVPNVRASDTLARWGGEEFLLLAPSTALPEALAVAEKMRRMIEGCPFAGAGPLSASFGVAEFDGEESFSTLVARADRALYRAKERGRNRVEWAPHDAAPAG